MTSIDERIILIEENLRRLDDVEVDRDEFFEYQGIKHTLQETIEACIDIASSIVAQEGYGRSGTYTDYYDTLNKEGIISDELTPKLKEMARFRNLLVHRYTEIDSEYIQEIITEDLTDIYQFLDEINNYLEDSE